MAMEVNPMVLEGSGVVNGSINLHGDGSVTIDCNVEESENPGNVLLEDLDSYWEDIKDRLTISRMVSDSVIKGMVNAIEQEAAEKIVEKELELVRLKESFYLYHVGAEESEPFGSVFMKHESGSVKHRLYSSLSDALSDYDRIGESMGSLKTVAKEQLKNLRKEIDCIKGSCSVRRIGSASEIFGMGGNGILPDKVSDIKWMDVDKTLDSLRTTIDTICKRVDNMVYLSKASLCQCQQEKEFEGEIEDMVIINCFRSLKEDYEKKLWYLSSQLYDNESFNWLKKIKEISSLREELNVISKSLFVPEIGHIASHGSMEIGEEWDTNKRNDHVHCKISGNPVSLSTSLSEGNGKHDESVIAMPENLDFNQLKHMTKEELVNYFKTELTKMKRNHEHKVTEMTEEYFSLKREYLREKGSSLPIKKDKEFDMVRKKIPEVLLKLDDILVENEKSLTFCKNAEGLCSLKDRLESLLLENHQLRSLLTDNKKEVKRLSLQVSDTAKLMLQHSLAEANLQCALDDAHIEASISEDVYKCILGEAVDSMKSVSEKSDLEYKLMQEIYEILFNEAAHNAKPSSKCEFEDSDLGSVIMQDFCTVIFGEALKEAEVKLNDLIQKYSNETELRVSVENEALDKERALRLEVAEKERLISERSKEFDDVKGNLVKALEQIEQYNVEVQEQKQKLELAMKELRDTNEDKRMLINVIEQKQLAESLVEAKDIKHMKQMQTLIFFIQWLSKTVADFECRVTEDIQRCHLRLDSLSSQSICLIQKANVIKRTGLIYKQKLERRCSDLQKAEAEVDLLGDEVDTLLSLLEKIYIALDHYSPILQHYPGIIEILKLVRRELSGESTKPV